MAKRFRAMVKRLHNMVKRFHDMVKRFFACALNPPKLQQAKQKSIFMPAKNLTRGKNPINVHH
jgi:hypothetical protein